MLKIGQNWVKLQSIPPNAQHKSAPLLRVLFQLTGVLCIEHTSTVFLFSQKKFCAFEYFGIILHQLIKVRARC